MDKIREYCASGEKPVNRFSLELTLFGAVLLAILLLYSGRVWWSVIGWILIVAFLMVFGIATLFDSPGMRVTINLLQTKKKGKDAYSDFSTAVSFYDDQVRIGQKYVFGRSRGEIVSVDKIRTIRHVIVLHYLDGHFKRSEGFIEVKAPFNNRWLCKIDSDMIKDESLLMDFSDELKRKNDRIKTVGKLTILKFNSSSHKGR